MKHVKEMDIISIITLELTMNHDCIGIMYYRPMVIIIVFDDFIIKIVHEGKFKAPKSDKVIVVVLVMRKRALFTTSERQYVEAYLKTLSGRPIL